MPSSLHKAADRRLDGTLDAFLLDARKRGDSWELIAKRLFAATNEQIDVSGSTVRVWHKSANGHQKLAMIEETSS